MYCKSPITSVSLPQFPFLSQGFLPLYFRDDTRTDRTVWCNWRDAHGNTHKKRKRMCRGSRQAYRNS